jgi:hypothetical protein
MMLTGRASTTKIGINGNLTLCIGKEQSFTIMLVSILKKATVNSEKKEIFEKFYQNFASFPA